MLGYSPYPGCRDCLICGTVLTLASKHAIDTTSSPYRLVPLPGQEVGGGNWTWCSVLAPDIQLASLFRILYSSYWEARDIQQEATFLSPSIFSSRDSFGVDGFLVGVAELNNWFGV